MEISKCILRIVRLLTFQSHLRDYDTDRGLGLRGEEVSRLSMEFLGSARSVASHPALELR